MFRNIFSTIMLVLTVELLMAVVSILATNVTGQLDENAKDLLTMRVRNRASYVQDLFFGNILVFGLQQVDYTHWKTTCKARKMPIFFVFFRHYCQKSCPGPHIYAKLWVLTHRFCVFAAEENRQSW